MKISLNWLREWVDLPDHAHDIAHRLTMAGIECEAVPLLAEPLHGVVVGRIVEAVQHPDADRLRVCRVDAGDGGSHQIVCGASNARAGLLAPLALPGAVLPGGMKIGRARLRGVESGGMLCSAKELSLSEQSDGLFELDASLEPGQPIESALQLDDWILELEFTPNRGDALSVLGLARELAAIYGIGYTRPAIEPVESGSEASISVEIEDIQACPCYAGRIIEEIDPNAQTPQWMRERLRRTGVRSLGLLVDVTNYVLFELGQPMHAFDADRLAAPVSVRRGRSGEKLSLLNGQTIEPKSSELLIADAKAPLALAGVMGGGDSEVSESTTRVFLESACFTPAAVAGTGRRHKLHTDAAYRYERGVDPALQRLALERASRLIIEVAGGRAGAVVVAGSEAPGLRRVSLRQSRLEMISGVEIDAATVESSLGRLGIEARQSEPGLWNAQIPSWRYDLEIEADLIEEVARLYGYDRIEARPYAAELMPIASTDTRRSESGVKHALAARGYHEAVSYSFVDPAVQSLLAPMGAEIELDNPIAETMSVMRTTLWSGLLPALQYNLQRQARRVRLFEIGARYELRDGEIVETQSLSGLIWGEALPEQWGSPGRLVDFFDAKGDIDAVLGELEWERDEHAALHPGQTARVLRGGHPLGWMGSLHPRLVAHFDLPSAPILFELDWAGISPRALPNRPKMSEYPSSRRDLALSVRTDLPSARLVAEARAAGAAALEAVKVFDVYVGPGLPEGCKSVALSLIFQDYSRTLTEHDVDESVALIVSHLGRILGASVRG
ncbi:phenylalanine--tRNA ligase subunit beta [Algiphilus sp. W345]|uniref:Phenylalanine--tRNA ligase beta subunit n=1 Tax=Banduia mediterranea TaxID=3075609 RepID=A0ABU2WJ83_9GAMM|nr:phenylalanine--tRNA ligase subunit beta [Algiphilus sp. W345]MDT0497608.1 phenylalanine--tRNA ligase subunit beta [Algiphilus sp. W345]